MVDTHFNQRGRPNRLFTIFAHNPQVLGIGIDENTAIEVEPGTGFTVIGEGAVMVLGGRVSHTNAASAGDEDTLALTDAWCTSFPTATATTWCAAAPCSPTAT